MCVLSARLYHSVGRVFILAKGVCNMRIIVNGRDMLVADKLTISEFVANQGYNPEIIVVEYNKSIVNKQEWQTIQLQPEDCLEVISFVGGG